MSTETKLWHLENFNLFKTLSAAEKIKMSTKVTHKKMKKNEYVYFPDDPSSSIYFLKGGRVKIGTFSDDGKEIIKTILEPGEVFGELGLIGEGNRKDFAVALENNVTLCALGIDDMEDMMEKNSLLGMKVTKMIGFRLQKIERRLEALIFKDARTRIIDFIVDLADEKGKPIGKEILVKHNLTHQDIANLTATSRQTVTTVLNELKDMDLLYLERNKVLIRDINQLKHA
ncbi:MAG: Crp/Fnr family transcriptional regulator [Flavobacteriales bacterium]|nr:Crp/Fnr family transcriptional regulator [Flavobacteriales bacterium]